MAQLADQPFDALADEPVVLDDEDYRHWTNGD
jgi:hypothetical protein